MKIQQKDLYHGAALTQLVEHTSFKALNKADGKHGHYLVNADCRLLVKLTKEPDPPWKFTFQADDLATLRTDIESNFRTFVVLVCGNISVCLLEQADFSAIIDLRTSRQQWIRVDIPKAQMRVCGSSAKLVRAVKHNAFPDDVFAPH